MFWDKGYTPSQNIEALLQKENVTVDEFLDDEDLLQECKTQKRNLVQYLTRPDVIKRLIEFITTEPPEDLPIAQRFRHASVACEVLTFGLPSLNEKLVEDPEILKTLYSYLEQEPPLNPLLSSFFSKTFCMLIWKKYDQDWFLYQKMCLQVLEFIKAQGNFLDLIFKHFATPVIMDLLLQIIKEVQGGALKKNLYEWLAEQQLVERLIYMLGKPEEEEKHNNIADFLYELIKHSRSMRQNDQDNDCLEPAFVGSNPLLLSIENEKAVYALLDVMLQPDAKESTIVAGITIVLTLVDESIVDEPASDKALQMILDREKENHEKIVSTVIKVTAPRVKDFHELILNPPNNTKEIVTAVTKLSPPFGFTRLQICRLFTVLLQTGNKDIIDKICEIDYFNTLLKLFKQYIWNNFLHSEVEKCLHYVFATFDQNTKSEDDKKTPSALQTFVIVNCKLVSKLIDCWMENREVQSTKTGRRLGYMGHLIKIFKSVTSSISKSDHIGALIESNLSEQELENWKLITNLTDGELKRELDKQTKWLANSNAYESADQHNLPKEFHNENFTEFYNNPSLGIIGESEIEMSKLFLENLDFSQLVNAIGSLYSSNTKENEENPEEETQTFQMDNFADFDAHFGSFSNDLGDEKFILEKSDNNANLEKFSFDSTSDEELSLKNAKNKENDCSFDITNDPWQIKEFKDNECDLKDNKAVLDAWNESGDKGDFACVLNNGPSEITKLSNGPIGDSVQQEVESCETVTDSSTDRVSSLVPEEPVTASNHSTNSDTIPETKPQIDLFEDTTSSETAAAMETTTTTTAIVENGPV